MKHDTLRQGAAALGLSLSADQLAQFQRYLALLLEWNQRLNLTAVTDPEAVQARHFLDSLSGATVTGELNGRSLVDVGAGGGFPGLPLKLLYPGLALTLVESVAKKSRFLEAVVSGLNLDGVTVLAERAETLGHSPHHRGRYDWAVARAVADLRVLAEYLLPLNRVGGRMLAYRGGNAPAELAAAAPALTTLGGGLPRLHPVTLPFPGGPATLYLVEVEKVGETPPAFPRRPGLPARKPL